MRKQKNEFLCGNFWKVSQILFAFLLITGVQGVYAEGKKDESTVRKNDFSFGNAMIQQQRVTIKGTVVDSEGDVIIGANVVEDGTTNGAMTGVNGDFTLTVAQGASLRVSYIGYVTQVIPVRGTEMSITLREDTQVLDEVVVTGFGMAQRKATLSGAITTIGSEEISRSSAGTATGALVGKMAGLNSRQPVGRPGYGTTIEIRNYGTPLFVIDGIQTTETQFNHLDFNDIETVTILKDASAAIYGMQSANGVVVVTTKSGQRNARNTVSINGYYGWQNPSQFPRPANVETYITNYIQSETVQNPNRSNYTYSRDDLAKWKQGTEKGYVPFDWYDFVLNTAPQTYINANVSGGSEKINYYVSIGQLDQKYMFMQYGGFTRTNFQSKINADITNRLRIGFSMSGRLEHETHPGVPQVDDTWMPRFGIYRNLPTRRPFANDNPKYPTRTSNEDSTNMGWLTYELAGNWDEKKRVMQLVGNFEYDIFDGLLLRAQASYMFDQYHMDNQEYTYKLYDYDPETDTYPVISHNTNPWRERQDTSLEEITSNVQLSYKKNFGDHYISVLTGFETRQRSNPNVWVHARPLANAMSFLNYSIIDTYNDDNLQRAQARMGWANRLNYSFADKYLIEALARYDGSWKFPPGHKWGFFPAASVGWRVSQESFWIDSKMSNFFSDLKVRVSYGIKGSDDLGNTAYNPNDFRYLAGYSYPSGSGSALDGAFVTPARDRGLPVLTMSWIKAKEIGLGIDFGFLNNKLTGQLDYFRRQRDGIAGQKYDVLIPSEVGFSIPYENLGSDVRMGWEGQLRWRSNINDFQYFVGGNVTYSRRYDWEQYKPRFGNSWDEYRNSQWHRFANINWGYEAIGQFKSWEEIANYPIDNDGQGNKTIRPGDVKYKDVNGDGIINGLDQLPIGYNRTGTPILNYGINLGVQWKGFDLAVDFTGGWGYTWYQESEQRNPFHDGGNNPQYYMKNTWRLADIWDANSELISGKYPMLLVGNSSHSNYWNSSFWKTNMIYLKIRNFELGYSIPRQIINKVGISDVRFYVSGSNLYTFSNLIGVDPETDETNGLAYPTMRIINVGLNIKF